MKKEDKSVFMAMIVKLYYIDHKGQVEIAKMLNISQAKVSRLLAEARQCGMVQVQVGHYEPRNKDLEQEITKALGIRDVTVIRSWNKQSQEVHYKNIGYFAAPFVAQMIKPESTICISAGRHIAHLVSEFPQEEIRGTSVIQTMGSVGHSLNYYDAAELGRKLSSRIRGSFYQLQAPAIATSPTERDLFMKHPLIESVLKRMNKVDVAIVGIGTPKDSVFIEKKVIKGEDVKTLEAQQVIGEICGRFYDINGTAKNTKYSECVIGITLEQLRKIPQVVGITSGAHRAAAIRGAIAGNIIKALVTDEETAEALLAYGA